MRALKIRILGLLFISTIYTGIAQVQTGITWTHNRYTAQDLEGDNQRFLEKARIHYQSGDIEETFFALQNAVESAPQSPGALVRRAKFKHMIGMQTEAAEDIRLAKRLNPYAADLYGYNGPASALNLLAYQPTNALYELAFSNRLISYYQLLNVIALEEGSDNMELELLDEVLVEIEENRLEGALILLYSLISLYPESAIAYDLKGLTFYKQSKYEDAEIAFFKAVNLQPDFAIAWYNLSIIKHKQGKLEEAKKFLDKAIELQADLTKAYFERALVKKSLGDKKGALKDYNKVINMRDEYYLEAYLNRGLTRKMLGDFNGALTDLNKVIEEQPNNALLYKNRGNLYFLFGRYNEAIDDYTRAILQDHTLAEAYFNRGLARFLTSDAVEGCRDLTKSEELGYERAKEKRHFFCKN